MPVRRVEGKRAMLNLPGHQSTASIVAEIVREAGGWHEATFDISDCDRKISLSFGLSAGSMENNLYKVDTIIDAAKTFRRALVKAHKERGQESS